MSRAHRPRAPVGALLVLLAGAAIAQQGPLDQRVALTASQAVLGRELGDYTLLDSEGQLVRLSSFRGKPLLVNVIYTGCAHVCPTTTLALHRAIAGLRRQFSARQFNVVSIGFNQPTDSPVALRAFAAQQRIADENWTFLSPRAEDVPALTRELGFSYVATPAGFDHVLQVTLVDAHGRIQRQIYGGQFNAAAIGEPLKDLIAGRLLAGGADLTDLLDRMRILCSVYDARLGRYRIDYTLPLQVAGGLTFIVAMGWFAWAELRARRSCRSSR
jgi:protein SCO1